MTDTHHTSVPLWKRLGTRLALQLALAGSILLAGLVWFGVSMYADEHEAALQQHADDVAAIATVLE